MMYIWIYISTITENFAMYIVVGYIHYLGTRLLDILAGTHALCEGV